MISLAGCQTTISLHEARGVRRQMWDPLSPKDRARAFHFCFGLYSADLVPSFLPFRISCRVAKRHKKQGLATTGARTN